jgi:hypothetical protein
MEFQAFLSWFSRNRLLLDNCATAGKPMARDFIGAAWSCRRQLN